MAVSIRVIRAVAGYSTVLLLSKGLTLASSYLLALNVNDQSFGLISLAQAGFATALALLGINAASGYVRYYYSSGFVAVLKALRVPYYALITLSFLATIILAIHFYGQGQRLWFAVLPITGLIASWLVSGGAVFRCASNIFGYAMCELGRPVIVFAAVLTYVVFGLDVAPFPYYVMAIFGGVLITFLISLKLLFSLPSEPRGELRAGELMIFLLPLAFVQITSLLNNVSDRYFLAAYVPLASIGLYGKAYLLGSSLGMLFDSISLLWAPYIMKHRETYVAKLHVGVGRAFFLISILSVLAALMAAGAFNYQFADDRNRKLVVVTLIVTSAFLMRVGYQMFVPVLCAFDETKDVARISVLGAVIGVLANLILIPRIGIYGAAVATFISFAIISIGSLILVRRSSKTWSGNIDGISRSLG